MSKKQQEIRNIVVVSDTHCGCRLGLCCPEGIAVDGGGRYIPSNGQLKVWSWWREFWDEWVPSATKGEPYYVVFNGDVVDGVHHGSTTQISHNMKDQRALAQKILVPIAKLCNGRIYWIRGTEAHVGQSAVDEEQVAEDIGAIANSEGQHARWEMWLNMGGKLVHFAHHVGTTSSSAHESSAVNAELTAMFVESALIGSKPPSMIVRSHRHRSIEVRIPTGVGYATAVVTPAWQLKTPFCYKIAGARVTTPQIGGVVLRLDSNNEVYSQTFVRHVGRSEITKI